jgi:hypothetical protein
MFFGHHRNPGQVVVEELGVEIRVPKFGGPKSDGF